MPAVDRSHAGERGESRLSEMGEPEESKVVERDHVSSWRTLVRSFTQLSAGEMVARLFGFIALIAMTRRLGPDSFGVVALGTTLVLWLKMVVDAGTETLNVREIARHPERFKDIAGPVLALRLALSALAVVLFVAISQVLSDSQSRWTLSLFALAMPAIALNLRFMVLGLRGARGVAMGNISGQLLFAVGILMLVHGPDQAFVVPLLLAVAELVYGLVVAASVRRDYGIPLPRIDLPEWRTTLRGGLPLMVNQLSGGVVQSFDLLLITVVLGSFWTGVYGAAYKPLQFLATLMALLGGSFLASYSAASATQARDLFHRTARLSVAVSVVVSLGLSAGATFLMPAAFGQAYSSGSTALAILAWFIPLAMVANVYGTPLIAQSRQARLMRHYLAAALFNVVANVIVIPVAGIDGAAVVTVLSYLLLAILNHHSCVRLGLAPSAGEILSRAVTRVDLRAKRSAG